MVAIIGINSCRLTGFLQVLNLIKRQHSLLGAVFFFSVSSPSSSSSFAASFLFLSLSYFILNRVCDHYAPAPSRARSPVLFSLTFNSILKHTQLPCLCLVPFFHCLLELFNKNQHMNVASCSVCVFVQHNAYIFIQVQSTCKW